MKTAHFERFSVHLPDRCVVECSASGSVDEAVAFCASMCDLDEATPDAIRAELKEYGAWDDDELSDDEMNRHRIVWIAAGNIRDKEAVYGKSL